MGSLWRVPLIPFHTPNLCSAWLGELDINAARLGGRELTSSTLRSWMSASTKAEALHKLANLEVQIGRPKVWIDYTKLAVSPDDLYGDAQREKAFDWQR